jgi:hypothetical protein
MCLAPVDKHHKLHVKFGESRNYVDLLISHILFYKNHHCKTEFEIKSICIAEQLIVELNINSY